MNITFIGGGNMASSLVGGMVAAGFDPQKISVVDIDNDRLAILKTQYKVQTFPESLPALDNVDIVVLSVKPQVLKQVVTSIATTIANKGILVITIAAGIRTADIDRWLGSGASVVRAMPNTPALVQCGASALFANAHVSSQQHDAAEKILRATGLIVWLDDEQHMDVVTALSGSGPAYFFRIMESLEKAAIGLGLPEQTARLLTLETAMGAAKMALTSELSIAQLREQVTSPGGTTEQGLTVMNNNNIDKLFQDVIEAAHQRATALSDELGGA